MNIPNLAFLLLSENQLNGQKHIIFLRIHLTSYTYQQSVSFQSSTNQESLQGTQPSCLSWNFWCPYIFGIIALETFTTVSTVSYPAIIIDYVKFCWSSMSANSRRLSVPAENGPSHLHYRLWYFPQEQMTFWILHSNYTCKTGTPF